MDTADIIYWIFGKGPSPRKNFLLWIRKKPIFLIHWIGSDVLNEKNENPRKILPKLYSLLLNILIKFKTKRGGIINFAVTPWLVDELQNLNISSIYVPLTSIDKSKLGNNTGPFVKEFDFISYVPSNRFEFYGGDKIIDLAKRWTDYKFLIIHSDLDEIPLEYSKKMPSNVVFSPRITGTPLYDLYRRSKVFIRFTKHDGLSLSVLESMYYKLQVLWVYDFPYTIKIKDQNWLSDSIPEIINNWQPNEDGSKFVLEKFSISSWKTDFLTAIKQNIKF